MAAKRDYWQPVGDLLYHFVIFGVKTFGFKVHGGRAVEQPIKDLEPPLAVYCTGCGEVTTWHPYFWPLEKVTDYECSGCGAVS